MDIHRPVWAEIDLGAVRDNVRALRALVAPSEVMAVVKAEAYGHGTVPVARAAVAVGASILGVALVEEGVELREAGVDAPILVLSEPVPDAAATVVAHRLTPVVYTEAGIDALALAASGAPLGVHLKVDTGMHRVGCRAEDAVELAQRVCDHGSLTLAGVCTHFAVADEPKDPYTDEQIARFTDVLDALRFRGIDPGVVHACNTAAALAEPDARFDLVRIGIGIYGVPPSPFLADAIRLQPAMSLKARVSQVKHLPQGARVSYGLRYELPRAGLVATVPVGYADGVPRELGLRGGAALVRGRRCPIAGAVTMDQLMLDVGDLDVQVGDEVVLLGRQGDEEITASEWADRMHTIGYTIVCGIGPRVPRRYVERP